VTSVTTRVGIGAGYPSITRPPAARSRSLQGNKRRLRPSSGGYALDSGGGAAEWGGSGRRHGGGDEFAVLLPGADAEDAARVAEELRAILMAALSVNGQPLCFTTSRRWKWQAAESVGSKHWCAAPCRARTDSAGRIHSARGADRPNRAADRLGTRGGDPPMPRVAAGRHTAWRFGEPFDVEPFRPGAP
jgi:hypothetical protein